MSDYDIFDPRRDGIFILSKVVTSKTPPIVIARIQTTSVVEASADVDAWITISPGIPTLSTIAMSADADALIDVQADSLVVSGVLTAASLSLITDLSAAMFTEASQAMSANISVEIASNGVALVQSLEAMTGSIFVDLVLTGSALVTSPVTLEGYTDEDVALTGDAITTSYQAMGGVLKVESSAGGDTFVVSTQIAGAIIRVDTSLTMAASSTSTVVALADVDVQTGVNSDMLVVSTQNMSGTVVTVDEMDLTGVMAVLSNQTMTASNVDNETAVTGAAVVVSNQTMAAIVSENNVFATMGVVSTVEMAGDGVIEMPSSSGELIYGATYRPVYKENSPANFYGLVGNVARDPSGVFGGNCAYFGTTAQGNGCFMETGSTFLLGSSAFTMEAWIKGDVNDPVNTFEGGVIASHWHDTASSYRSWRWSATTTTLTFEFRTEASATLRTISYTLPADFWNGTWRHIAVQRRSNTIELYTGGARVGSTYAMSTNTFKDPGTTHPPMIGAYGAEDTPANFMTGGYLDEMRVTIGSNRYGTTYTVPTAKFPRDSGSDASWAQVRLLLGFDTNDWGFQPTGTFAATRGVATLELNGGSNTFQSKVGSFMSTWGGNVGVYPYAASQMNNDYVNFSLNTDQANALTLGTSDFTIDFYLTNGESVTTQRTVFTLSNLFSIRVLNGNFTISVNGLGTFTHLTAPGLVSGSYRHIAVTRQGTQLRCFLNGVLLATQTISASATLTAATVGSYISIGGNSGQALHGLRVVKDQALYTANFTPPTLGVLLTANAA